MLFSPRPPKSYGPMGVALAAPHDVAHWNLLWLSWPEIDTAPKVANGPLFLAVYKTYAQLQLWPNPQGGPRLIHQLLHVGPPHDFVMRLLAGQWQALPLFLLLGLPWRDSLLARAGQGPAGALTCGNVVYAQFGRRPAKIADAGKGS